jgi:hypothetical protein
VVKTNEGVVTEFASNFISEQLKKQNVSDYSVSDVYVPWTSVLLPRYEVFAVLKKKYSDQIRTVDATITGHCLVGPCVISLSSLSTLGL